MSSASIQLPSTANAIVAAPPKSESKPKPCCVCKDEKAIRDECMLFSKSNDAQKDCASTIEKYKSCMAGFGFNLP
ncbi:hypothetical protein V494_03121 [Pseudogymnoascus sp. VKM F-4513 (FW-928)]|nr:hypothetical protein V494_03121 [Pseudogymnoascus sp. VKM F-4513 (FW-928)]